jgi:hypothetical protein
MFELKEDYSEDKIMPNLIEQNKYKKIKIKGEKLCQVQTKHH